MGMDVYGKAPKSETGQYFRASVWTWHPIWTLCCEVAPEIIGPDMRQAGHYNDGAGLDDNNSRALADVLRALLDNGSVQAEAAAFERRLAALADETCNICGGTGVRTDKVGAEFKFTTKVIDAPGHPRHGETGWCNGCDGKGRHRPFDCSYRLPVEQVAEFEAFLRDCGGFEIQ